MAVYLRCAAGGTIEGDLASVLRSLSESRRTAALTGAGISVDSGIPDFRSSTGLWRAFDPAEYATLAGFLEDPDRSWRFFRALGKLRSGKKPNRAHEALAELEGAGRLVGVVTQNVDGLHQAAGSRLVIELHGNGSRLRCLGCGGIEPFSADLLEPGPVPRCRTCARPLKPDVVLFGEDVRDLDRARALVEGCDLLLVVGTSGEVVPAAWLPEEVLESGGSLIEFNLEPTRLTLAGLGPRGAFVEGPVSRSLPLLVERLLRA